MLYRCLDNKLNLADSGRWENHAVAQGTVVAQGPVNHCKDLSRRQCHGEAGSESDAQVERRSLAHAMVDGSGRRASMRADMSESVIRAGSHKARRASMA